MSRMARRAVIATKGAGGPTYDEFVTHITGLATGGSIAWGGQAGAAGSYRTTAAAATGSMYGTSWSGSFYLVDVGGTTTCRLIQHGLPSLSEFEAQVAAGRQMFFGLSITSDGPLVATDRNGYLSLGSAGSFSRGVCTQLLFWSGSDTGGSAFSMNPSTGTGPTPYTW